MDERKPTARLSPSDGADLMRRIGLYIDASRAASARDALLLVSQALDYNDPSAVQVVLRGLESGAHVEEVLTALNGLREREAES